jgi:Protein of unknown function (DUF5661)
MWNFQKTSTDNHDWTPGKRGAGYIHARTNTPDSFNLLDYSIRTWNIGADNTDDIEREIRRRRPIDIVVFKFYITPSGGVTDRGEGFQNRTSRSDEAVIDFLHRKDNRLHDGREDIKTSSLEEEKEDPMLHFNPQTGKPCYCGFGSKQQSLVKKANLKYKDIMRGKLPKNVDEDDSTVFQHHIVYLVAGYPGAKKVIPWIVSQMTKGNISWERTEGGNSGNFINQDGYRMDLNRIHKIADLLNATDSPYQNKFKPCPTCDKQGDIWDSDTDARVMCPDCGGWGNVPSNAKEDLFRLDPKSMIIRANRHKEWVEERERIAESKERAAAQETVYTFDNGYYVTLMNPDAEEAEWEGISQGNCFQSAVMPYQRAVEDERLTVYVLRDKNGQGHALWGYNPDGTVCFMESSGRLYGGDPEWEGYTVHSSKIRKMISEANAALGLSDAYGDYNPKFEEEEEEEFLDSYQLGDVITIDQLINQYKGVISDLSAEDDLENLQAIAVDEARGTEYEGNISPYTEIERGYIDWHEISRDFFNERREYEDDESILNEITAIAIRAGNFDNLFENFDSEADTYRKDSIEEDMEVKAWDTWRQLHTNQAGEVQSPGLAPWQSEEEHIQNEKDEDNPWAFSYPAWEDVQKWHGLMPASVDPLMKKGEPFKEKVTCDICKGAGVSSDGWGRSCWRCQGSGMMDQQVTIPSWQERKENQYSVEIDCPRCGGSGTMGDETCGYCDGTGKIDDVRTPLPSGKIYEDPSGQLHFGKTAAQTLKNFVSSIFPRHSHSLTWVKGGKGRGLMLNDGTLITWPVNKKGNPQHPDMYEYLTNTKLPETHSVQDFTEGTPFDIYEDGTLAFFSEDVPADLILDLSKIDYRLKVSKISAGFPQINFNPQMPYSVYDTEGNSVYQTLKNMFDADQKPRLEYQELIRKNNGDWEAARQQWIAQGENPDDMFGDVATGRAAEAKSFIEQNIETINQSPEATKAAWLLVQHMDFDVPFQQWFLTHLEPGTENYKFLSDRVNVNTGQPQEFGTQGVEQTMQTIMARSNAKIATNRSLYHGTILDNIKSIQDYGLTPQVGENVETGYGAEVSEWSEEDRADVLPELVFMTDKTEISKAINFMIGAVADKLNKQMQEVTENDIRNHGLIVKVSGGEMGASDIPTSPKYEGLLHKPSDEYDRWPQNPEVTQYPEVNEEGEYHPMPVETGDYYSYDPVVPDTYLYGSALVRFVKQNLDDSTNFKQLLASAKKEFTKEDVFDLMDKLHYDYDANEFWMGMNDELEHSWLTHGDPETTAHIVSDHLKEHPNYYTQLRTKISKSYSGFATHFHPYTGQQCNCQYGRTDDQSPLGRTASQAVRKVKNQNQKHLKGDEGYKILDWLHKLISGHSLDEKGEFGEGEYPGIEGMVPWIVKQLKTGWIKPFVNDDGSVADMGQLDSYYEPPEKTKAILSKRAALPIDVEGMSDLSGVRNSYGKSGYKFVTGEIDNPNVKIIYINNFGENNLDSATIQSIVESRPDIHIFVSEKNQDVIDALREQYQNNPLIDISNSPTIQMRFIVNLIDEYPVNPPTDYSIEIPDTFYNNIPWNNWSDWFNATNAPAREGKDIMKMTPTEVANSSREHQQYLSELREQEELKKRFADTKDDDVVYRIQDPKYRGWTVKQIKDQEDAELETEVLGHCIGSEDQNYAYNIEEGNIEAFSLRDKYGIPKLTWHYNPDGTLAHIQGKSNDSYEMFRSLVTEFNAATNHDDDNGGSGSEDQLEDENEENVMDEVQLPDVDTVEEYTYQYHEDGDGRYELAMSIAANEGATLSDEVRIDEGEPHWQDIVEDLFKNYEPGSNDSDEFFSTIMQNSWSMKHFAEAADQCIDDWEYEAQRQIMDTENNQPELENTDDPNYLPTMVDPEKIEEPAMFDYYRQWKNMHTNPKTGELEEPRWLGWSGKGHKENYEEKQKKELENPWSFMPQWSELKTKMGEPATGENGYPTSVYLPASQDPKHRDVATEDIDQPCRRCEGRGSVPTSNFDSMNCPVCKGTGNEQVPITIGPNKQRVLEEPSGQMYLGKLTSKEKAEAWDKPAHKLSKAQAEYINGEL